MARIRTIKPEFFTSEQVAECSPNARLMFVGLWCFADDSGVHPASAARIKMEVFPADQFTKIEIDGFVSELVSAGLLQTYQVEGQAFLRVTGWSKHQKIDQPTYKHPLEDGQIPANVRRASTEHSPKAQRTFTPGMEWNGEEGKGKEIEKRSRGSRLPADWQPTPEERRWAEDERPDIDVSVEIEKFRDFWHAKAGAGGVKLDWTATFRNWMRNANSRNGGKVTQLVPSAPRKALGQ